jgi:tetratricopeptide (TPR) repeat protein
VAEWYATFLEDKDEGRFVRAVSTRYSAATLARLARHPSRAVRRAAVFALGFVADYECNAVLGQALNDRDRGVRMLADDAIRGVWCRVGTREHRHDLNQVIRLVQASRYVEAIRSASELLESAPAFAEAWNQRAIAWFGQRRFAEALADCRRTLKLNPFHFGAAAGMAQCYLEMGDRLRALAAFKRALAINPGLESVRVAAAALARSLNKD